MHRPPISNQLKAARHTPPLTTSTHSPHSLAAVQERLRQRRSPAYVTAMSQLDTGGHQVDRSAINDLVARIQEELPEVSLPSLPLGIVARCYLGPPFEVHSLDRSLKIIRHYRTSEPLPGPLERARQLAYHPSYAFVEVYSDSLIAVQKTGDVSVISL